MVVGVVVFAPSALFALFAWAGLLLVRPPRLCLPAVAGGFSPTKLATAASMISTKWLGRQVRSVLFTEVWLVGDGGAWLFVTVPFGRLLRHARVRPPAGLRGPVRIRFEGLPGSREAPGMRNLVRFPVTGFGGLPGTPAFTRSWCARASVEAWGVPVVGPLCPLLRSVLLAELAPYCEGWTSASALRFGLAVPCWS